MKGKNEFTKAEVAELRRLIKQRCNADRGEQKKIRDKMRDIGFYGWDDFRIYNMTIDKFDDLISSGKIKILENPTCNETI